MPESPRRCNSTCPSRHTHPGTETVTEGRPNDRYRDLIDILMLWDLVGPGEVPEVRDACTHVFDGRRAHPWPPRLEPPDHWTDGYRALAAEIAFPLTDLADATEAVNAIVIQLAGRTNP